MLANFLPEFCLNLPNNNKFAENQNITEKLEQKLEQTLERKKLERKKLES